MFYSQGLLRMNCIYGGKAGEEMSLFELRMAIEQAIPWWTPFAIFGVCCIASFICFMFDKK